MILPFFGGVLVDRFGVRLCLLLFSSLIAVGQVIFAVGVSAKSWPLIFLGRLVFGFGGESFTVANSALLADWFKGKELALAFGINLSISKLGSVINNLLSPILTDKVDIAFALWFGAILCGFGVVCVLLVFPIDRHLDAILEKGRKGEYHPLQPLLQGEAEEEDDKDAVLATPSDPSLSSSAAPSESFLSSPGVSPSPSGPLQEKPTSFQDVLSLKHIFWVLVVSCVVVYGCVLPFNNISSSLLLERDYFQAPPSSCALQYTSQCESDSNPPVNCPSSQWYQPPLPHNYSTYDPLTTDDIDCTDDEWDKGCTSEYCDRLSKAETQASFVMSIPYIISAVLSPPVGFLVDLYGFRAVIAAIAPAVLIIVHLFLAISNCSAIGPLVGQGLAYTGFVSVLWPSVPLVVEERVTGLAFGIVTSMQNLACAVIPLIVASIYSDSNDKYIPNVEFLFVGLASVGFLVGLYMNYYDYNHGGLLNSPYQVEEKDEDNKGGAGGEGEGERRVSTLNPFINDATSISKDDVAARRAASRSRERSEDIYGGFHGERQVSAELRNRSSVGSRGGSFTSYEEMVRAGRYKTH